MTKIYVISHGEVFSRRNVMGVYTDERDAISAAISINTEAVTKATARLMGGKFNVNKISIETDITYPKIHAWEIEADSPTARLSFDIHTTFIEEFELNQTIPIPAT